MRSSACCSRTDKITGRLSSGRRREDSVHCQNIGRSVEAIRGTGVGTAQSGRHPTTKSATRSRRPANSTTSAGRKRQIGRARPKVSQEPQDGRHGLVQAGAFVPVEHDRADLRAPRAVKPRDLIDSWLSGEAQRCPVESSSNLSAKPEPQVGRHQAAIIASVPGARLHCADAIDLVDALAPVDHRGVRMPPLVAVHRHIGRQTDDKTPPFIENLGFLAPRQIAPPHRLERTKKRANVQP